MSNPLFFAVAALGALALIALALVVPQGTGARSPAPFGHPVAPPADVRPVATPALRGHR